MGTLRSPTSAPSVIPCFPRRRHYPSSRWPTHAHTGTRRHARTAGANGLANPRDFLTPVAAYEDKDDCEYTIVNKFNGALWTCTQVSVHFISRLAGVLVFVRVTTHAPA